jgi:SAM-dependent methyltransferase
MISKNIQKILICPSCGFPLKVQNDTFVICEGCNKHYSFTENGSLDLRLQEARQIKVEFELGPKKLPTNGISFSPLNENREPQVNLANIDIPYHLSRKILSYFPKAATSNSMMLDLGCGSTIHRGVCEHAGFEYVGVDYDDPKAPFLGDAHALPFKDESFEFILTVAVLEHIRYPFVMMSEASRVLQPGGKLIGTVAFLEPFHLDSYYHHSHLGSLNSLVHGGFSVSHIAPHSDWTVLTAQAVMGLFPRLPRRISKIIVLPVELIHKSLWYLRKLKNRGKNFDANERIRNSTGAFTFIAYKPMSNKGNMGR